MTFSVIADDLTGASDAGVQLVRAGYRSAVAFWGTAPLNSDGLDAVAFDTDSRTLAPSHAAERVTQVGQEAAKATYMFKKLDSTLRGPVAAELAAAFSVSGRERVVLAPAFPQVGRTTVSGVQLLHGVPIHQTELARDPLSPVRESHLPTLVHSEFDSVAVLSASELVQAEAVWQALQTAYVVIADAQSEDDLLTLVQMVPHPERILWAGSAGLADALSRTLTKSVPLAVPSTPHPGKRVRVLAVVGSVSTTSREQLAYLVAAEGAERIVLQPLGLSPEEVEAEVTRVVSQAGKALEREQTVALTTPATAPEGANLNIYARVLVTAMADAVARLSSLGLFDALVMTGGDTAVHIARALAAQGVFLKREIEPGIPLGVFIGASPYPVVTKAGAFGSHAALKAAVDALTQEV